MCKHLVSICHARLSVRAGMENREMECGFQDGNDENAGNQDGNAGNWGWEQIFYGILILLLYIYIQ